LLLVDPRFREDDIECVIRIEYKIFKNDRTKQYHKNLQNGRHSSSGAGKKR
jgi:hypothetical protein